LDSPTLFREILDPIWQLSFDNTCEDGMICDIAEKGIPEWRATLALCQNSRKKGFLKQMLGFFGIFFQHGMLNLPEYC